MATLQPSKRKQNHDVCLVKITERNKSLVAVIFLWFKVVDTKHVRHLHLQNDNLGISLLYSIAVVTPQLYSVNMAKIFLVFLFIKIYLYHSFVVSIQFKV